MTLLPNPTHPSAAERSHKSHGNPLWLALAATGVVYGDIGTSPLYAVSEIFFGSGRVMRTPHNVVGCISLVVWTLTLVVSVKYLTFVLRADNEGEGGTFALYGLVVRYQRFGLGFLMWLLMLAAGLLFGEGIITPAISVLSAVEGIGVAAPTLSRFIVPLTLAILTALFAIQSKGTARVGAVFGPVIVCWFAALLLLGMSQVVRHPEILAALDPTEGARFLHRVGVRAALPVLGSVVLAITGGEALFADMGHFGKRPIRASWFALVYPALLASYLGQGAFVLSGAAVRGNNVFYSLVPQAWLLPMVVLATSATIIASQALISGAFSLASQGIALGLLPRLKIVHTHHVHSGQIYLPFINWSLYVGCMTLVVHFGSSTALAAAYGLSVSGVMLATSIAMTAIARLEWRWGWPAIVLVFGPIALIDLCYLTANSLKFLDGGYIPLSLGALLFLVMTTWRWGRKATSAAYASKPTMTMGALVELKKHAPLFDRNAVLMAPPRLRRHEEPAPALLQLIWDRYGALPKNLIFVEVVHKNVPYAHDVRCDVHVFERDPERGCIVSVELAFGFMEEPNVEKALENLASHHLIDLPVDPHKWVVHAVHEHLLPSPQLSILGRWRLHLFSFLRQVSQPAYYYYGLGNEVQMSTEILPVRLR
jgi:KUP system potassium uptake protein